MAYEYVVGKNAITDYTENSGWSGLHNLAHHCHDLIVVSEDFENIQNFNPFYVIAEMMKKYPMEALRRDKSNLTPLSWAISQKNYEIVAFMASYNPNPIYTMLTLKVPVELFSTLFDKMMKLNFERLNPDHDINRHFEIILDADLGYIKENELQEFVKHNFEIVQKIGLEKYAAHEKAFEGLDLDEHNDVIQQSNMPIVNYFRYVRENAYALKQQVKMLSEKIVKFWKAVIGVSSNFKSFYFYIYIF